MTPTLYRLQLDALTMPELLWLLPKSTIAHLLAEGAIGFAAAVQIYYFQAPTDGQIYYFLTSIGRG